MSPGDWGYFLKAQIPHSPSLSPCRFIFPQKLKKPNTFCGNVNTDRKKMKTAEQQLSSPYIHAKGNRYRHRDTLNFLHLPPAFNVTYFSFNSILCAMHKFTQLYQYNHLLHLRRSKE